MRRLSRHGALATAALLISLAVGTAGFHWVALQSWLDAFLNASMLLGGMGPVGSFDPPMGKVFAALYALYAGIVFLVAMAIFLVPIAHRILHSLHLDEQGKRKRGGRDS